MDPMELLTVVYLPSTCELGKTEYTKKNTVRHRKTHQDMRLTTQRESRSVMTRTRVGVVREQEGTSGNPLGVGCWISSLS